jgi:hypothetical protein
MFCYALQLTCMFVGSCFGHGMSKATQYATIDINICVDFLEVNLKDTQSSLQKSLCGPKNLRWGGRSGSNLVWLQCCMLRH